MKKPKHYQWLPEYQWFGKSRIAIGYFFNFEPNKEALHFHSDPGEKEYTKYTWLCTTISFHIGIGIFACGITLNINSNFEESKDEPLPSVA